MSESRWRAGGRRIREWMVVVGVALLVATALRSFVVQQFYISGPSMETTLVGDDRVLVNKLAYRFGNPSRGDVVVFDRITGNGDTVQHDDLIKRVIGLPGEELEIKECVVYVNGTMLDEPWLNSTMTDVSIDSANRCGSPEVSPITIPNSQVFLIGDNRPMSYDSRMFGAVEIDLIVGRALVVIWPPSDIRRL